MESRSLWARTLSFVGGTAMLLGAVDPLEGSLLILPGSALFALGVYLGRRDRRIVAYRAWMFGLIAFGVGAMFALSSVGGFGGESGRSAWWGLLILPYLIGWTMSVWGPGSPRWMLWGGIVVGAWHLVLLAMILRAAFSRPEANFWFSVSPGAVLAVVGLVTIVGCVVRLVRGGFGPITRLLDKSPTSG